MRVMWMQFKEFGMFPWTQTYISGEILKWLSINGAHPIWQICQQTGQNPQIQLSYPRRLKAVIPTTKSDIWVWTYNIVIVIKHKKN